MLYGVDSLIKKKTCICVNIFENCLMEAAKGTIPIWKKPYSVEGLGVRTRLMANYVTLS